MAEVSILIPTWNRVDFVMNAIKTAMAQTVQDIEIVVYDDGSTDKTSKLIGKVSPMMNILL